ncbi:MAG: GFA family protein [Pseudomonadota bacterium]
MAATTYRGSCQCGAVRFTAALDLDHTVTCNCSRCRRLGSILAFTAAEGFTLEQGADATSEYLFNRHLIRHHFCRTCGIEPFARAAKPDGTPMVAVNVRCLDGVDASALTPTFFDGASA